MCYVLVLADFWPSNHWMPAVERVKKSASLFFVMAGLDPAIQ